MVAVSRASTHQAATMPGGSQALGEEDPPAELRNGHHLFRQRHKVLLWSSENMMDMMFWVMFVLLLKYFKVSGYLKYLWPCPLTAEFGHKDTENKAFGVERQAASTLLPQLLRRSPSATCTQQHESTTRTASGILGAL